MKDKIFSFAITAQQLEDLIDAIENDRRPFVDEKEGRKGVELILAAYRSEKPGKSSF